MNNLKLVFLCGGISKRMEPIKDKIFLDLLGKSLLQYQIELAQKSRFKEFVFIGNENNLHNIRELAKKLEIKSEFAIQKKPKGMADALLSARDILEGKEILVVNPNDIFEFSAYSKLLNTYKGEAISYIVGHKVKNYFPGGYMKTDKNNLLEIIEKPGEGNEPSDLVNIVIHLHKDTKTLYKLLENTETKQDDIYETALSKLCKIYKVKVVPYSGFWQAIKYPWDILDITKWFLGQIKGQKINPNAKISNKGTIDGPVVIADGVRIFEGATIRGPTYIGENSIIGNNALVRESHVGKNCEIGFSTEVARSYIGDNTYLHWCYVGDSIVGNNCNLAAGTTTANWRHDNKNVFVNVKNNLIDTKRRKFGAIIGDKVKTGIGTLIYPGRKIGGNKTTKPGEVVKKDIV